MSFRNLLEQFKQSTSTQEEVCRDNDSSLSSYTKRENRHDSSCSRKRQMEDAGKDGNNRYHRKRRRDTTCARLPPKDFHDLTIQLSFLCIGAQKAGTSWLHEILSRHASLSLPSQKEVHFWDWNRKKGLRWYCQQFLRSSTSDNGNYYYGEITPCYAVLPLRDIEEIQCLFPKVKILFIARDLVERAWSAVTMELRNSTRGLEAGRFAPTTKNANIQNDDADPDKYDDEYFMDRIRHSTHSKRSDYASSLRNWLRYFSPDDILILNFCDIAERPRCIIENICDHIGMESKMFIKSLSEDVIKTRVNFSNERSSCSDLDKRPSLRKKIECYLSPMAKDFNSLLEELGYKWKLNDYTAFK